MRSVIIRVITKSDDREKKNNQVLIERKNLPQKTGREGVNGLMSLSY